MTKDPLAGSFVIIGRGGGRTAWRAERSEDERAGCARKRQAAARSEPTGWRRVEGDSRSRLGTAGSADGAVPLISTSSLADRKVHRLLQYPVARSIAACLTIKASRAILVVVREFGFRINRRCFPPDREESRRLPDSESRWRFMLDRRSSSANYLAPSRIRVGLRERRVTDPFNGIQEISCPRLLGESFRPHRLRRQSRFAEHPRRESVPEISTFAGRHRVRIFYRSFFYPWG